jgi:hypothetical protein
VIAADIGEVTVLVIICVSPTLIIPPLVTVFVFVVCADTEAIVKTRRRWEKKRSSVV